MIGIVVDEIENNPSNYIMFRELNKVAKKMPCFVFANSVRTVPMDNEFTILQQVEAMSHSGTLIATSLITSQIVSKALTPKNKFYYLMDFEWLHLNMFHSRQLQSIFFNDDIEVINRSKKNQQVFSKLFRKSDKVVYNWRADELLKVI